MGPGDARPKSRRTLHKSPDPEIGAFDDGEASRRAAVAKDLGLDKLHQEDLHMYRLLQEQYNYTTIDHGSNCELKNRLSLREEIWPNAFQVVCIGANWLHHRPKPEKNPQEVEDIYRDSADIVPPKHWAWYILTNEGE